MKKARTLILVLLAAGLCGLGLYVFTLRHPRPAVHSEDRFPIVSRFELPRDYGYFIGDEIPLTLVIEANGSVVLDLVNLPQKGEKHGLFEIRDLTITSATSNDEYKVYRASYILQYFGATPLTAQFAGLEILYALADERSGPNATYSYKSLFTQPAAISMSRIGPFRPTHALDLKGPLEVQRSGLIWMSYIMGTVALSIVLSGWLWEWRRYAQRQHASLHDTPAIADTILHTLKQEGATYRPLDEATIPAVVRLSHILRQYLHDECGVAAFTSTTTELAPHVTEQPFGEELLLLLERCETLKYQPPEASQVEERQLWWEAIALFEKLQKDGAS